MTILIIDTSRKEGFVALARDGQIEKAQNCPSKEFLLHASDLAKEGPLLAIAVGIGPGSYTGTRAGATFAKTLAFALNIPVIGFLSPLAYLPDASGPFATTVPAKQGDTCLITGIKTACDITEHTEPKMVPKETLGPETTLAPEAPLNLPPLATYLERRLKAQDLDPSGEVAIAYLYDIPVPTPR